MRTYWQVGLVCIAVGLAGCAGDGHDRYSLRNLFETDRGPDPTKFPPASTRAATRVNAVGSEIVAQNKDAIGITPAFFTMGVNEVEVSHTKDGMVIVSEGLVERCPTDTELAAVICHELGKIAAEKAPDRRADRDVPTPRMGRDVVGGTYEPDMTGLAAQATFDRRGPAAGRSGREPRPDAHALAESFFVKSGRKVDDFARMDQLIHQAEDNADKRASEKGR